MTNIPIAGLYKAYLANTTLREASPGEEQIVGFRQEPDMAIISMLQESDLYATINCRKDQYGEIVKVVKGSYSSNGYRVRIVRGVSRFADNSISQPIDLSNVRNSDIYLDFYVIHPSTMKQMFHFLAMMTGNGDEFVNRLPKATKDQAGLIKTAIDSNNHGQHSHAITAESPLWINLIQAIYGENTDVFINQEPSLREKVRSGNLKLLMNLLDENPVYLERLTRLAKELNNKKIDKLIKMVK
jgi:hypothetical protein